MESGMKPARQSNGTRGRGGAFPARWLARVASVSVAVVVLLLIGAAMAEGIGLLRARLRYEAGAPEAIDWAVAAGDSDALDRWGDRATGRGDRALAERAFQYSVRANPRAAGAWMALGFVAERKGDSKSARADFERAFQVDRQYLPAWTLANFCFRREDSAP